MVQVIGSLKRNADYYGPFDVPKKVFNLRDQEGADKKFFVKWIDQNEEHGKDGDVQAEGNRRIRMTGTKTPQYRKINQQERNYDEAKKRT